jgi:uncharacterized protein (DUF58 family)
MRLFLSMTLFFILFLLGLITLKEEFILLSLPLAVYIGVALISIPADIDLKISRKIEPSRFIRGDQIEVLVQIHNSGNILREVIIEDIIPDSVTVVDGHTSLIADLCPDEHLELNYKITGKRGIHHFEGLRIVSGDPFGLFQLRMINPIEGEVRILPRSFRIKSIPIRPEVTKGYTGFFPSKVGGTGVEFFNVREYQPGDAMNTINWSASARSYDRLFSNEYQMENTADIWLILDARRRSDFMVGVESLFEIMVEITTSVAQLLIQNGNRVGLLIFGGFLDWTYLGSGKKHREKVLAALTKAKTGESRIFNKLGNLPTRIFPPRSQIIFVSPIHSEDYVFLSSLRGRLYQVLCISPDPISFELGRWDQEDYSELGVRIAKVERRFLLSRLRYSGIQVLNLDSSLPIEMSLGRFPAVFFHRANLIRSQI